MSKGYRLFIETLIDFIAKYRGYLISNNPYITMLT